MMLLVCCEATPGTTSLSLFLWSVPRSSAVIPTPATRGASSGHVFPDPGPSKRSAECAPPPSARSLYLPDLIHSSTVPTTGNADAMDGLAIHSRKVSFAILKYMDACEKIIQTGTPRFDKR